MTSNQIPQRFVQAPAPEVIATQPRPMTRTPKQRRDVQEVARMLRESREASAESDTGVEADYEDENADVVEPEQEAPPQIAQPSTEAQKSIDEFGPPEWFKMPADGLPPDVQPGTTVIFVRFPVSITGDPKRGERQCACRPLTTKLERFARAKTMGAEKNGYDLAEEYTKAMVCVVDGSRADFFAKGGGSVNHFWAEIGPKARELLIIVHNKLNRLDQKEREAFLASCVAVRTVA